MLIIGRKPWSYHAYLPCLRCLSPLFTMPISLVYDAHLPCLWFYFACFWCLIRTFSSPLFSMGCMLGTLGWWVVGQSIVLSVWELCSQGRHIVVWRKMTDYTLSKTFVSYCILLSYRWLQETNDRMTDIFLKKNFADKL